MIRKKLGLKTQKSHGLYIIPSSEKLKLERLYERYGIEEKEAATSEPQDAQDQWSIP